MTTRDVLMETKNVLLTRGWHQGGLIDELTGAVCVLGALSCAVFGDADGPPQQPTSNDIVDYVLAALAMQDASGVDDIDCHQLAKWNDHPSRTPEDILDMLDRAIASVEPSPEQVPACVTI